MMQIQNIIAKLDELFQQGKGQEAEQLIKEAMGEAKELGDAHSLLMLLNEMIGYMRETSRVEESYEYSKEALLLMESMNLQGSISYATTLLNIANAYRAGGRLEEALSYYSQVEGIYQKNLDAKDMLFASLYNNLSLVYQEQNNNKMAKENLLKALEIVVVNEDAYFEEAVTYSNLAATCLTLDEDDEAAEYFRKAIEIYEAHEIYGAHYSAALSAMGTYYYKKNEYEKAAEYFEHAMKEMKAFYGENDYYKRLEDNLKACKNLFKNKNTDGFISGLSLCKEFYETYGRPMILEQFPEYVNEIAVGLCGEGSDCFGLDDEFSKDHDWGPGFCMWISDDLYGKIGDKLQEAYENLPVEMNGYQRKTSVHGLKRTGVTTISDFYKRILGEENFSLVQKDGETNFHIAYQNIPDEAFAAAVNGEVFVDPVGLFSIIREKLKEGFPERIYYLKIAESCAKFSQAAQYNYERMLKRKDSVALNLSKMEGLKQAMKLMYYLENEYPLHDKWLYQGMVKRGKYIEELNLIYEIATNNNEKEQLRLIEQLAVKLAGKLYALDIISDCESYLDVHVEELLKKAKMAEKTDEELVNMIFETEFLAFVEVRNTGGRASCQNDRGTFEIMRKSQYLTWNRKMLMQYLYDFETEYKRGHNLIEEKYGRMMESTAPDEYKEIADNFSKLTDEKKQIIEAIVKIQVDFMEKFSQKYPHLAGNARSIHTSEDRINNTSYETYLRGEISTYSDKMLELYGRFVANICMNGGNLAFMTMEQSVKMYGYESLEVAEKAMH